MTTTHLPVVDGCWKRIGVRGDRSCPELAAVIHCHNCAVFAEAAQTLLDRPASEAYLSERTAFVAEPIETRKLADRSAVLFGVGGESFALQTDAVVEVGDAGPPRRVPHRSNDVFAGLIHIQGRLELCVSLSGLLGLDGAPPVTSVSIRVLVASAGGQRWVFPVDSIAGIQRFHPADLIGVPATSRRSSAYVVGLIPAEGGLFGLLDLARICEQVTERLR